MNSVTEEFLPLSYSGLKAFRVSPKIFLQYKTQDRDSASMRVGRATHSRWLTPERWDTEFTVYEGKRDKRMQAYQDVLKEYSEDQVLNPKEFQTISECVAALESDAMASDLLAQAPTREQHIHMEIAGLPVHGFVDASGPGLLLDLKTTRLPPHSAAQADKELRFSGHHRQLAMYREGLLQEHPGRSLTAWVVWVRNAPPYDIWIHRITDEDLAYGLEWVNDTLELYKQWDGRPVDARWRLDLPFTESSLCGSK